MSEIQKIKEVVTVFEDSRRTGPIFAYAIQGKGAQEFFDYMRKKIPKDPSKTALHELSYIANNAIRPRQIIRLCKNYNGTYLSEEEAREKLHKGQWYLASRLQNAIPSLVPETHILVISEKGVEYTVENEVLGHWRVIVSLQET